MRLSVLKGELGGTPQQPLQNAVRARVCVSGVTREPESRSEVAVSTRW